MEIVSKNISIRKTARYFLAGNKSNPEIIIFVLHGYGMPALNFLNEFNELLSENILIISPEGLSRFYTKGFYGNIGASWMTSQDRENEIGDYIHYLDEVYSEVLSGFNTKPEKIILLGFSQGGSTVTRWAAKGKVKADRLIVHSSDIPKDIDFAMLREKSKTMEINLIYGDADKNVRKENYEISENLLNEKNFKYRVKIFHGGHEINIASIKEVLDFNS